MIAAFVQSPPPFPLVGEVASLTAAFIWAGSVTIYRHWAREIPPYTLNLLKCGIAFVCLAASLLIVRPPMPTEQWVWGHLMLSGVIGLAIGDTAFFAALRRLGAQATSCGWCLSPFFTVAFAMLYLGEALSLLEAAGVTITVVGVAGVMYFGSQEATPMASLSTKALVAGLVYVLISAIAQAIGLVIAREAFQKTDVLWGTFMRMTPALVVLALFRGWNGRGPQSFTSRRQIAALGASAFFGTYLGVLLMSTGTKYAPAGLVSALTSTFPLWVIPIARLFLKEPTTWRCILCTLLAVAGIALMGLARLL